METLVSDWLIEHLPPEAGPVLSSWAAHFDTFRPIAVIAGLAILGILAILIWQVVHLARRIFA